MSDNDNENGKGVSRRTLLGTTAAAAGAELDEGASATVSGCWGISFSSTGFLAFASDTTRRGDWSAMFRLIIGDRRPARLHQVRLHYG